MRNAASHCPLPLTPSLPPSVSFKLFVNLIEEGSQSLPELNVVIFINPFSAKR